MKSERIYEFGPFRLEVGERRLLRGGQPVTLRAKVFDTLCTLVENHGTLVTKDELMRAVWPDSVVEEGNLAHNLTVLRKALDDNFQATSSHDGEKAIAVEGAERRQPGVKAQDWPGPR